MVQCFAWPCDDMIDEPLGCAAHIQMKALNLWNLSSDQVKNFA